MVNASTRIKNASRVAAGSDSDSDGEGPEEGDEVMESRPEKQEPIIDDDGFELVQKRR
jgi:hypothetical protein